MIDPKPGDEGKWVTYISSHNFREAGIISSWNDRVVFVRYHAGDTSAATTREDLIWGLHGNLLNRTSGEGHFEVHPERTDNADIQE